MSGGLIDASRQPVGGEATLPATVDELRSDIALTRSAAYFQTGSEGPVADSTQRVLFEALRMESHTALLGPAPMTGSSRERNGRGRPWLAF